MGTYCTFKNNITVTFSVICFQLDLPLSPYDVPFFLHSDINEVIMLFSARGRNINNFSYLEAAASYNESCCDHTAKSLLHRKQLLFFSGYDPGTGGVATCQLTVCLTHSRPVIIIIYNSTLINMQDSSELNSEGW